MKIDLCKLLGVKEGEEFKFADDDLKHCMYKVENNVLKVKNLSFKRCREYLESAILLNTAVTTDIIKLPKKKEFTDDELCILRNIKSEINTLGRNINGTIYVTSDYGKSYLKLFNNLFQSLDIGEEIIIDDYVER